MQTRRTRRFRPAVSTYAPAAPAAPADGAAPPLAAGFVARRRPRRSALAGDPSRVWRVVVLLVIAVVAFRPLSAFCQFIVEEYHKAAVATGSVRTREEVADARALPSAEVERAAVAPSVEVRPAVAAVVPAREAVSPFVSPGQLFRGETVNPYPGIGGGTVAPVFAASSGSFPATDRRAPVVQLRNAVVPNAAGQDLVVDQADGQSPYSVTTDQTFDNVTVGDISVGTLDHGAGTLTVTGTLTVGNAANSSGSYTLHGTGSLVTSGITVGEKGNGLFTQSGGMATTNNGAVYVGSNGGNGSYVLSGTGSLSTYLLFVGNVGGSQGSFVQSGGTVTATSNQGGIIYVGNYDGSQGNYLLSGTGTVSTGSRLVLGTFNGSQGSFNLNGGTLTTPAVSGGGGTGTFNFNGGTLQASASDAPNDPNNPTTFFSGVTTANVRNGGAVIDTQAFNVTVASALTHSTLGTLGTMGMVNSGGSGYTSAPTVTVSGGGGYGATAVATINAQGQVTGVTLTNPGTNYTGAPTFTFSGGGGTGAAATDPFTLDNATDGGLTKVGAGTLTLAGANTYTGTTYVAAGTLAVPAGVSIGAGSTGSNLLFIDGPVGGAAATLLISGGSVTAANGVSYIGNTGTGVVTVTAGSLTAGDLLLGTNTTGQGTLNVSGTGSVSVGSLQVGYDDTSMANLSGTGVLKVGLLAVGEGANGFFTQSGSSTVQVSNFLAVGRDDSNGNAGVGTYNLQGGTLTTPITYVGNSNTGTASVFNQTGGTHTTGVLEFGYVNTNSAGTYVLGSGGTLTTGQVLQNAGTGTFEFNGGTLKASASDNPGAASNPTTFFSGVSNAYVEAGGAVINTNSFNVTIASALIEDPAGTYGSDGGLTKTGAGTLTLGQQNGFYGPVMVNGGTLQAGASANAFAFGQGNSAVTIANVAGATLALNGNTEYIGSLAGGGTTGGTVDLTGGTLITGNDGTNTTFAGTITGNGGLTKGGTGMFTVTGNNLYTGTTYVGNGALMVCNVPTKAGDSGTGTGPVYVDQGAWLGGTGTIGGSVTVGAGPPATMNTVAGIRPLIAAGAGTLTPGVAVGDASMPGRLTINGSLTFTTGTSMLEADLAGANAGTGYDQILVGGNLTLAGTLTLTTGAGFTPFPLEKFYLIDLTGTGTVSGTFDGLPNLATVTDSAGNEYFINYYDHDLVDMGNPLLDAVSLTAIDVVPEPSVWTLMVVGVIGLGFTLRRRLCACRG